MAKKKVPITTIIETVLNVVSDKTIRKALLGVYSDGTPRSFADCLDGEVLSPKDRAKAIKKAKKKKKKSKIKL